jgi:hypothetical protein
MFSTCFFLRLALNTTTISLLYPPATSRNRTSELLRHHGFRRVRACSSLAGRGYLGKQESPLRRSLPVSY